VAGLALRPEGAGRIWLTPQLSDDPNPDAPAARATLELVAPRRTGLPTGEGLSDEDVVRLEWREVWWAQSFGLPNIGAAIRWARVQAREQAAHLLLPISWRKQPVENGAQMASARTSPPRRLSRLERLMLRSALAIYALLQYIWKLVQWLILTPAILLLLVVMGVVRLLSLVPFLQSSVVASLSSLLNFIMLHWVAAMQVYLLDYTRSSAMRWRFERELAFFRDDPACDRIVVVAHSWGTVIAYEGLTTVLGGAAQDAGTPTGEQEREAKDKVRTAQDKPVTFLCLAQALRRAWLLDEVDPARLRRVLPAHVRWRHFWARYDPVTAGPLSPRSLPPLRQRWSDATRPEPSPQIRTSLARCENIPVVNTDGTLTDHTA
jgi:hypothetical protein